MNRRLFFIYLLLLSFCFYGARASHIVGGEFTYKYIQDTSIGGVTNVQYLISLTIYEDCLNGNPGAIAADVPAAIAIFKDEPGFPVVDTIYDVDAVTVSVPVNFSNACVSNIPPTCLLKKTFTKIINLRPSSVPYIISYQRCCRNAEVVNISEPGNTGSTYYCVIPPTSVVSHNNSAVFKNYPPQVICRNNPLYYDHSATDADGDSLSYGFCSALNAPAPTGATSPLVPPNPPPYDTVLYIGIYSGENPMPGFPPIQIDPSTGLITGTPNTVGRYLVTIFCNEYRDGTLINTIKREFQFVVTNCTKVVVADIPQFSTDFNTYIVDCDGYTVNFVNNSTGGFAYHWDFGVPGSTNDTSSSATPSFTYPDTGTYTVKLVVNPGSTCPDSIERLVKIYPYFHAKFSDTGRQCPGLPISFIDMSTSSMDTSDKWSWDFGDGGTSILENPVHTYTHGGTYNVVFIAANNKACVDTVLGKVYIDNFGVFAGNDTVIVKGESVQFDATGGTNYYWSPGTNLSDTSINDPVGYYPDTGTYTYYVHVTSEFGCSGYDTIKVIVVGQSEFFVPTAFTPDGDGLNDLFRPVAVGYRSLGYFRVFNRWGQMIYNNTSLDFGWDGTYKNQKVETGTYYWEISFTDRFGKQSELKGDVTLIR